MQTHLETTSKINYLQGDYGLDKFSIKIDYIEKNRSIKLYGFKRSYFGNYNQYYANTLQPQAAILYFSNKLI